MEEDRGLRIVSQLTLVVLLVATGSVVVHVHLIRSLAMRAYERRALMYFPTITEIFVVSVWWGRAVVPAIVAGWAFLAARFLSHRTKAIMNCLAIALLLVSVMFHGIAVLMPLIGMTPGM